MKNKKIDYKFSIILTLAILIILITVFANYLAPYNPDYQNYDVISQAPNSAYLLGTDYVGRDILSRILYGGRYSLLIALLVTFLVALIGIIIGLISGYLGGIVDVVIMRVVDLIMSFPYIVFVIAVVTIFGGGLKNLILAMTLISWTNYARVTRAMVISLKNNDFINQAKLNGASNFRIMYKYLAPNVLPYLIVLTTQDIANNLLTLSSLSLLGIGVQPPTAEWGLMLSEGKKYIQTAPWILFFPGIAIFVCVIVFNLLGDSFRDILDPKE
ncbi:ABC transporter permease [Fusobacterium nucleatum]|uniref:nickel transporter permease n=1 Tax=Fusobacterium nucleatum TaxID=851 RepID=UPI003CFD2589